MNVQTRQWVYIYALIDPFTFAIRYIGKSIRPRERLTNHCNEKTRNHRTNWIKSVLAKGKRPGMRILARYFDWQDWRVAEQMWIAYGREMGWPLVNGTDGGDGVQGLSDEARERIASAWRGRKHSSETLLKIGAASKGRTHTEEYKKHMRELMKKRIFTPEHRRRLSENQWKRTAKIKREASNDAE